jgi:hypothetical protein
MKLSNAVRGAATAAVFFAAHMNQVVAYLKRNNLKMLGEPSVMKETPSARETWMYFLARWGIQLELVSYPKGKAYEKDYKGRLWNPMVPAK